MQCPLCNGPLHVEDEARFVCERGHGMDPDTMRMAANSRATRALWMAIEALESEAEALRMLASMTDPDGAVPLAEEAEADARVLRELAGAHLPPELQAEAR